jgi:hypothetical protein
MNFTQLLEYDLAWCACDHLGRVAVFTTGGFGMIPDTVAARLLDIGFEKKILDELMIICDTEVLVDVKDSRSFVSFASRGLYSFDCLENETGDERDRYVYKIAAKPRMPISLNMISPALRTLTPLKMQINFETCGELSLNDHLFV